MRDLVPNGHPFRKLRNSYRIWPFVKGEDDWWMEPSDPRPPAVEPLVVHPKTVGDHPADKYLGHRLHDARMIGVEAGDDSIELRIDDYDVWRLSTAYEAEVGAPRYAGFFPVTLTFTNLNAWAVYLSNPLGRLSRLHRALGSNLAKVHEFSGDRVIQWDADRFVGFFTIRVKPARWTPMHIEPGGTGSVYFEHYLALAIDAGAIGVFEGQRAAWVDAYGEASVGVFDAFWVRRAEFVQGPFCHFEEFVRDAAG